MLSRLSHLVIALLFLPLFACAADSDQYQEGVHYVTLPQPVPTQTGDKVEVAEVFWYGCGHCYSFEPLINAWKKSLPEGAELVRSPAIWRNEMKIHAQMYYAADALGMLDKLHEPLFSAMHVDHKRLLSEDEIFPIFAAQGVDRAQFDKVFSSFKVRSDVNRADARQRGYKISGTPELVVNGKYRISSRMTGSQSDMLKVASYLVDRELAAK
jgi:thiol:disulfide interchange protein DsbA